MTVQGQANQVFGIIADFVGSIIRSPLIQTGLHLAIWALIVLWFVTVFWAYRDARARTRNWLVALGAPTGVALATPMAFPLAVLIWRILRPAGTVAEAREQQLTIEALRASTLRPKCPGCWSTVNAEWRRCPWCRSWLQSACPRCERFVELNAVMCPWCALDLAPATQAPQPEIVAPGPGTLAPQPESPARQPESPAMAPVMAASAARIPVMDRVASRPKHARAAGEPPTPHGPPLVPPTPPASALAAEPAVAPAQRRPRRSRGRASAPELRRPVEESASSTALW